jgi:4'-phosphopantetheinyl transferase
VKPASIEVWEFELGQTPDEEARERKLLGEEELRRAARFHFAADRRRFVIRRAARRRLIAKYLGVNPCELVFAAGPHGKPALEGGPADFHFNCSASGDRALIAVARAGEVGIDLERRQPLLPNLAQIASRFSASEQAALQVLPKAERVNGFFDCWTRKEAFLKALGCGLSMPLDHFTVSVAPGTSAAPVEVAGDPEALRRWAIVPLDLGPDFSAAVASKGTFSIRRRSWMETSPGEEPLPC